jgi:hypothetical protein
MFEIGIFCVILLAIGYWVALWLMGRHDDVLHGDFVHAEQGADYTPASLPTMPLPTTTLPTKALPTTALPPASLPPVHPSDSLQSLLASIKRDLKDAAQI